MADTGESIKPVRVQRRRVEGWRAPEGAVYVGRGSEWGNPWRVGDDDTVPDAAEATRLFRAAVVGFTSNGSFCRPQAHPESYIGRIISNAPKLRGKTLMCWCSLDSACHADVLLEIANG